MFSCIDNTNSILAPLRSKRVPFSSLIMHVPNSSSSASNRFSLDLNLINMSQHQSPQFTSHSDAPKLRRIESFQKRPLSFIESLAPQTGPTTPLKKKSPQNVNSEWYFPQIISSSCLADVIRKSSYSYCNSETSSTVSDCSSSSIGSESSAGLQDFMIVDVRSPFCYSRNHVKGAVLAHCSSKLKLRRSIQLMNELFTSENSDESILRIENIFIYTDSSIALRKCDPLVLLIDHLKRLGKHVQLLEGGFKEFRQNFPDLCESGSSDVISTNLCESKSDCKDIFKAKASQVLPFLYLGNEIDANNDTMLARLGINHVLNVTSQLPFLDETKFRCCRLPASDCNMQDLRQYFSKAFAFIESARLSEGSVLLHCQAGISRSATVAIAYIMAHSTLNLQEAYQHVKRHRGIISPNFSFLGQLLQFEEDLVSGHFPRSTVLHDIHLIPYQSHKEDAVLSSDSTILPTEPIVTTSSMITTCVSP